MREDNGLMDARQMATAYLVSSGEYSDYSVSCVFSTREKAEDFVATFTGGMFKIEERDLDPDHVDMVKNGYNMYSITMDRDGNVERVIAHDLKDFLAYQISDMAFEVWKHRTGSKNAISGRCWARSKEHAIKIANEARTRLIAEGKLS